MSTLRIHSHFNDFDTSLIGLNTCGRSLDKHLHESWTTHKSLAVAEILKVKPCLGCKAWWASGSQQILPSIPYLCPYPWKTISAGTSHHGYFTYRKWKRAETVLNNLTHSPLNAIHSIINSLYHTQTTWAMHNDALNRRMECFLYFTTFWKCKTSCI